MKLEYSHKSRLIMVVILAFGISGCTTLEEESDLTGPGGGSVPGQYDPDSEGAFKDMDGDGLYHHVTGCSDCHDLHNPSGNRRMILETILTPNSGARPVVFVASSGPNSFADGDGVYNGICEVCHTTTSHHRNSADGDHEHFAGTACVDCHPHEDEFHPSGFPDHSLFVSPFTDNGNGIPSLDPVSCTYNCHSTSFTTNENDPKSHDNCYICHDGITSPVTLISGNNDLLYGGDATDQYVPETNPFNNCYTCHGEAQQTISAQMHPFAGDHSGQVMATNDGTCETCHADMADDMSRPNNNASHSGCNTCHEGSGPYFMALRSLAVNGPGNCKNCHGEAPHDSAVLHDNRVITDMVSGCFNCHDVETGGSIDQDNVDALHTDCAACHDYQGTNPNISQPQVEAVINYGSNQGPVNCEGCHEGGFGFIHSIVVDHSAVVISDGPACVGCHNRTVFVDPADNRVHDDCATCHEESGFLVPAAVPGGGICIDCHGGDTHLMVYHPGWNQRHYQVDGYLGADLVMSTTCANCHLPQILESDYPAYENYLVAVKYAIQDIHWTGSCNACHLTDNSGLRPPAVEGGGVCMNCHPGYEIEHPTP